LEQRRAVSSDAIGRTIRHSRLLIKARTSRRVAEGLETGTIRVDALERLSPVAVRPLRYPKENRMAENRGPNTNPQRGGNVNQGQDRPEDLVGQATEAVRNVASSASDLAQDTYERGARYVRDGWDSLPDVDRYSQAVSRPVEQNPVLAILAAGAVGYLVAYLVHGGGIQTIRDSMPDYGDRGARREHDDRRRSGR